jgi:hypothetical protein
MWSRAVAFAIWGFQMRYIPQPIRRLKRHLFRRSDGERILRERFSQIHGGTLDLSNCKTFTEKLYRRMIETNRHGNPTFTRLADKFRARDYVKEIVGTEYLVPLLWSDLDPAKIPFDKLPVKSIAKTNHGSGGNLVLDQPIDRAAVVARLKTLLSQNYYWPMREYQYYEIEPRVMIEEFLNDGHPDGPLDYRFWCFNGRPEAIMVDNHPHTLSSFYSADWEPLYATYRVKEHWREIARPSNLAGMRDIAARLSAPFDFVRIDLYSINGKTYFGEFTFAPTAGMNKFDPPHWDLYFGEKWGAIGNGAP